MASVRAAGKETRNYSCHNKEYFAKSMKLHFSAQANEQKTKFLETTASPYNSEQCIVVFALLTMSWKKREVNKAR